MPGNRNSDDALFDDLAAEEERMAAVEQAEFDAAEAEEAESEANGDGTPSVFEVIDKLQAENADLKDQVLRMAAEMENLRRRTQKDVADARAYATTNFARDMLSVGDNLQRALEAVTEEKRESGSDEFKAVIEGVDLTAREMLNALERNGVKKIDPQGEKFDPHFHQAMFEVPNPDLPNNSVAEVVQPGYIIGERVLRPAMVGVAKGGPKWEDVASPGTDDTPDQAEG